MPCCTKNKPCCDAVSVAVGPAYIAHNLRSHQHILQDPYSRPSEKRGGAWMDEVVGRSRLLAPAGESVRLPVAHMVCNQTPPVGDKPSLMTFRYSHHSPSTSIAMLLHMQAYLTGIRCVCAMLVSSLQGGLLREFSTSTFVHCLPSLVRVTRRCGIFSESCICK